MRLNLEIVGDEYRLVTSEGELVMTTDTEEIWQVYDNPSNDMDVYLMVAGKQILKKLLEVDTFTVGVVMKHIMELQPC